ncbi:hypothetical protein PMIN03_001917 [Paraphaeosphaeria minitans]
MTFPQTWADGGSLVGVRPVRPVRPSEAARDRVPAGGAGGAAAGGAGGGAAALTRHALSIRPSRRDDSKLAKLPWETRWDGYVPMLRARVPEQRQNVDGLHVKKASGTDSLANRDQVQHRAIDRLKTAMQAMERRAPSCTFHLSTQTNGGSAGWAVCPLPAARCLSTIRAIS